MTIIFHKKKLLIKDYSRNKIPENNQGNIILRPLAIAISWFKIWQPICVWLLDAIFLFLIGSDQIGSDYYCHRYIISLCLCYIFFKKLRFEGLKINDDKAKQFQDFFCEVNCDYTHLKPPVLQAELSHNK